MNESIDPEWKDFYNILADDRQAKIQLNNINNASTEEKEEYFNKSRKFVKERKTALLTSLSSQVVTSELLKYNKNLKY